MTLEDATPGLRTARSVPVPAFAAVAVITAFIYAGQSGFIFGIRLLLDGLIALFWLGGCIGTGLIPFDRLMCRHSVPVPLRVAAAFALGSGLVSLATLLIGLMGWLNSLSAWGMLIIGLAVVMLQLLQSFKGRKLQLPRMDPWLLPLAVIVGIVLVACFVPPGALWADAEPNGYDVVTYHFQIPREWFESGVIEPLRHNVFSYFPFGIELQYLLAMHLNNGPYAGMYTAQLMHAVFVAMSVVATYGVAVLLGRNGTIAALASGLMPWLLLLAPIGFNEGGLLLYGGLAIGLLLFSMRTDSLRPVVLAGVFAGFACGAKLTAVPMVVLMPAIAMLAMKLTLARREIAVVSIVLYCVVAAAIFSPWIIRNLVWIGNPVFPEAATVLGKAYWSDEQVERWQRAHKPPPAHASAGSRIKAANNQILTDWRYGYIALPLAGLALALFRRREDVAIFVMLGLMLLFWVIFTHLQGRFFVLMSPLLAITISGLPRKQIVAGLLLTSGFAGWLRWQLTYYRDDNPNKGTIARSTANGVLGIETLEVLKPIDLSNAATDRTVVLVGDANAFWLSSIPMNRLRYRTVFNIDARGRGAVEAWCDWIEPLPSDAVIVIDPGELDRMSQTYGTPAPDAALYRDGRPYILDR